MSLASLIPIPVSAINCLIALILFPCRTSPLTSSLAHCPLGSPTGAWTGRPTTRSNAATRRSSSVTRCRKSPLGSPVLVMPDSLIQPRPPHATSTRGRPLPAVTHGVTARSTAQHGAEVVDEVCLVVPAEADGEVGEVDARVALDLQCGLL